MKEFEAKLEGIIDEVALLPVVQKLLKLEMVLTAHVDYYSRQNKYLSEPVVLVMAQSETADQLIAAFGNPEVQKVFERGKEFGLHRGTCAFGVDVVPKIDSSVTPTGGIRVMGFYNVPPYVFSEQHFQKHHVFMDNAVALPAMQKNFRKLERWQYNNYLDDAIQGFGYPAAQPPIVYRAESESLDNAIKVLSDAELHKSVQEGGKYFSLNTNSFAFSVDVVTKIDRS
ncbi:hypothetical protein B0H13DRAFT_2330924 [Mycena leptocephala]|nr:hypothetical protein B0H13DRAFT_2330924 [Mycena leptocephala]